MPARKAERDLQKVTVNLFEGEFHALGEIYPQLGPSKALRHLLHQHLKSIRSRVKTVQIEVEGVEELLE